MNSWTWALVLSASLASHAAAAEEHRELGPHVHGHGVLNIAMEGTRVSLDLDVPGMDIVGFEHAPAGADQQATVTKSEAQLSKALELFKLPDAARCKVTDAKVTIEAPENHADDKQGHDAGHEGHRDYNATYVLECTKPEAITTIEFEYFKHFKNAHGLTVNVVSDKSQNTYEVTTETPMLKLGGTM